MQKGRKKNKSTPAQKQISYRLAKELESISRQEPSVEPLQLNERDEKSLTIQLRLKEKYEYLQMRTEWSRILMIFVSGIYIFQMAVFVAVGKNLLIFNDIWLARLLFPGIFIEIIGLVYIVVKYLFPNKQ